MANMNMLFQQVLLIVSESKDEITFEFEHLRVLYRDFITLIDMANQKTNN